MRTGTVINYRPSSGTALDGLTIAEITLEDHEDDSIVTILLSDVEGISPGERDDIIRDWPKLMPDLGADGFTVTDGAGNLVRAGTVGLIWTPEVEPEAGVASVSVDEAVETYTPSIPGTQRTYGGSSSSSSEEDSDKKKVAIIAALLVLLLFLD